jgi:hypothetical protein
MRPSDFLGMDVLVGLTFLGPDGEVISQHQSYGEIENLDGRDVWLRPFDGGNRRRIPADLRALRPAPGGVYRLASSGALVDGPSLLTSWRFMQADDPRYHDALPNYAPMLQPRVPTEWDLSYRWDEDRVRRTIALFCDEYVGRTLLLGLNILDGDGRLDRQEQHVGTIMVVDADEGILILDGDGRLDRQEQHVGTIMVVDADEGILVAIDRYGRTLGLPGDPTSLEPAAPGEYRLRSTGRVVVDPDYIAEYTTGEEP